MHLRFNGKDKFQFFIYFYETRSTLLVFVYLYNHIFVSCLSVSLMSSPPCLGLHVKSLARGDVIIKSWHLIAIFFRSKDNYSLTCRETAWWIKLKALTYTYIKKAFFPAVDITVDYRKLYLKTKFRSERKKHSTICYEEISTKCIT